MCARFESVLKSNPMIACRIKTNVDAERRRAEKLEREVTASTEKSEKAQRELIQAEREKRRIEEDKAKAEDRTSKVEADLRLITRERDRLKEEGESARKKNRDNLQQTQEGIKAFKDQIDTLKTELSGW